MKHSEIEKKLFKIIDGLKDKVIHVRRDIHKHPELSHHEEHTKYLVKGILEIEGYGIKEFETHHGVVADLVVDENKPFVAIRADMDALPIQEQNEKPYASEVPGVMHACGHDAHTAIAVGAAIAFAHVKDELPCNIRFIFQPSEEVSDGGAEEMIRDGALENVKAIFGLHVYPYLMTGQIGYKYGVMMASADTFEIEVFGKSAHGARPHEGVDAILVASMCVNSLNHIISRRIDPLHPAVISLGTIEGGTAPNIICDHVKLTGTVRTVNEKVRKKIPAMMEDTIYGICHSMGAKYNFHYDYGNPELINDDRAVDIIVEVAKEIIGETNVIDLKDPVMGGEDFSRYLEIVPGAFFRLGVCNPKKGTCVAQHNPKFDVDEDALPIGMKILSVAALRAMGEFCEK
ncbi:MULTISPECIES: M20 family metallopeptidase [unclassified Nitratiruptor]|uniref:M20 family metallopeptidase n=1 Tax=unclassified Nitratiruptor TaxID=2624044 RepID=UPI00191552D7|nr:MULTISPECIES: M20 family metallopeptidase [unclassified Nitratiruptor]BCD61046.1 amidohydrolase [Nitratiruptor sp. YY08-10]BCD64978.1 amidohydrolase [Nitratiruptor sp. YY08-14]